MIRLKSLSTLMLSVILLSCGPASDYVDVKIITPFGMGKEFHQLNQELFHQNENSFLLNTVYCEQSDIFVGTDEVVNGDKIYTKKVPIKSNLAANCSSSGTPSACISSSSVMPNITIPVKKGQLVDIGILGAYYNAVDTMPNLPDGICDRVLSSAANPSLSLVGHQTVNLNDPVNISLPVWVMPAYPTTSPSPFPTPSNCVGCAAKDYLKITVNTSNMVTCRVGVVEYFKDANSDNIVHQTLYTGGVNNGGTNNYIYYVPHFLPMLIHAVTPTLTISIGGLNEIINNESWTHIESGCSITVSNAN